MSAVSCREKGTLPTDGFSITSVVKKEFGNMDALHKGIYSKNKYDLSECLCAVEMNLYLVRFS